MISIETITEELTKEEMTMGQWKTPRGTEERETEFGERLAACFKGDKEAIKADKETAAWQDSDRGKFVKSMLDNINNIDEDDYFGCARGGWVWRKDDPGCAYCEGDDVWWCAFCLDNGKADPCDEMDCELCHGDNPFRCDGCKQIYDGNNNTDHICLTRGVYCEDCWTNFESLTKCREKECDMCEALHEQEKEDGYTPGIGYTMTPDEERDWAAEQKDNEACFVERIARLDAAKEAGKAPHYEASMDLLLREREDYRRAYAKALGEEDTFGTGLWTAKEKKEEVIKTILSATADE